MFQPHGQSLKGSAVLAFAVRIFAQRESLAEKGWLFMQGSSLYNPCGHRLVSCAVASLGRRYQTRNLRQSDRAVSRKPPTRPLVTLLSMRRVERGPIPLRGAQQSLLGLVWEASNDR
jgi:hypothetical protein